MKKLVWFIATVALFVQGAVYAESCCGNQEYEGEHHGISVAAATNAQVFALDSVTLSQFRTRFKTSASGSALLAEARKYGFADGVSLSATTVGASTGTRVVEVEDGKRLTYTTVFHKVPSRTGGESGFIVQVMSNGATREAIVLPTGDGTGVVLYSEKDARGRSIVNVSRSYWKCVLDKVISCCGPKLVNCGKPQWSASYAWCIARKCALCVPKAMWKCRW